MEEDLIRGVFIGKEADNSRSVEGNPTPRRDLTAVSTPERRMDKIRRFRIRNFRVQIDVFVTTPNKIYNIYNPSCLHNNI